MDTPILMIIMETRFSGARAMEIIETLPFDGSMVADTIGFTGVSGYYGGQIWC